MPILYQDVLYALYAFTYSRALLILPSTSITPSSSFKSRHVTYFFCISIICPKKDIMITPHLAKLSCLF